MSKKKVQTQTADYRGYQDPQAMHIPIQQYPQQNVDTYLDDQIYNMVKGGSPEKVASDKKTYYEPLSQIVIKLLCLILLPLVAIFSVTSLADKNYYATHGDFSIKLYHANKEDNIYYARSYDTKQFEISTIGVKVQGVANEWQGYKLGDFINDKITKFTDDYDYFIAIGEDDKGNPKEVRVDYPKVDVERVDIMIAVFQIKNGTRYDVYGNKLTDKEQPKGYILFNPNKETKDDWVYNVKEIKFGSAK